VACDATARLYDVDEDSVVFKKLQKTEKYDQGTITFRARNGKLIDLDKLHESIWATRLSGGTRSGLVSLDVTAIGRIVKSNENIMLKVSGSDAQFAIGQHPADEFAAVFDKLRGLPGNSDVRLTGQIDNYMGRWPSVLEKQPQEPRRILVTGFEVMNSK
jgi:hypothetical protein